MAATPTQLMTVAEFSQLPEDDGPVYHELRHGELIAVTRPKARHYQIQLRLQQLLAKAAPPGGVAGMELAFRPVPEHELRVADVAYVSRQRWEEGKLLDYLYGSDEIDAKLEAEALEAE